jgi:hypothetical protein
MQKKITPQLRKKTLAMIYAMKKFQHYLLGNVFIFFVDYQTFLHLVNKPVVIGKIARWLVLLQEFDFKVIYKPRKGTFLPDHLFWINHGESP